MSIKATANGKPATLDKVEQAASSAAEAPETIDEITAPGEVTAADQAVSPAGDDAERPPVNGHLVASPAGAADDAHPVDVAGEDEGTGDEEELPAEPEDVLMIEEVEVLVFETDEEAEFHPDDPDDPDGLIDFAEPVDWDEPAAYQAPRRWWVRLLIVFGFLLAAAAIIGGAIAIVSAVTHGFKKPVQVTYKKSALFSLQTGNCFNPNGQSYTLIPCASPHVAEVFATFALANGKWPGTAAVAAAADSGCKTRLTGYLNPQLAISLASAYVYPDATAWQAGVRTIICEVRAPSGSLTGSVRGATATAG